MNKSPIYYTGNKYKLLKQIKQYFPVEIDTFYDVFGGSGTVSMNMLNIANRVVYNEYDIYVYNLFNYYANNHPEDINKKTIDFLSERGFYGEYTKKGSLSGASTNDIENAKDWNKRFSEMENEFYEKDRKNVFYHHIMKQLSFSNKSVFDEDGFKKVGAGNGTYKPEIMLKNMYALYNKGIETTNLSFTDYIDKEFNEKDFLYFDPPYWNTNANYNDGWTWEMETTLLNWLDELTAKGIKWAFSNVFEHNGKTNTHLKKWAKKGSYEVFYPHIKYTLGSNTENNDTVEVFITNYDPVGVSNYTEQLSLF